MNTIKEFLIASIFSIATFFYPVAGILLMVFSCVFLDTITAYMRVKKTKVEWTSRSFLRGFIPKMIGYTSIILMFFMIDKFLLCEFVRSFLNVEYLSTKVIALGLVYAEVKSIDENWKVIYGKGLIRNIMDTINFGKKIKGKLSEINEDKKKSQDESNQQG